MSFDAEGQNMKQCTAQVWLWLFLFGSLSTVPLHADEVSAALSEHNPSVPFCYQRGGDRSWPILRRKLQRDESLTLVARKSDIVLGNGTAFRSGLVDLSITENGQL
ncbi:MAG: hypothetical protein FJ267_01985, partial [Planctomycetes bacterium]|nr:hypothetical protein [Planctomycetota bacterium]